LQRRRSREGHIDHDPEEPTMKLYSAADLHSNNHFLSIIDEQDKRILESAYRTIWQ